MSGSRRTSIVGGLLLILLGLAFFGARLVPGFRLWFSWPLFIIGFGLFLLIIGLVSGQAGTAIPACIFGGLGALLYWQNLTGRWDTWSFAWTLFPGFVGIGMLLAGLLGEKPGEMFRGGVIMLVISAGLFLVAGSFLGGLRLGAYWPILLIALGVALLIGQFAFRRRA